MKSVTCIMRDEPVAKGRPRARVVGGKFVQVYTDAKTRAYEKWIGEEYLKDCGVKFDGSIKIAIEFYHAIPKSTTKANKIKMLQREIYPSRNDLDNCIKALTDGLNKIAYDDDSQIVEIKAKKVYAENPRIEFTITEVCI